MTPVLWLDILSLAGDAAPLSAAAIAVAAMAEPIEPLAVDGGAPLWPPAFAEAAAALFGMADICIAVIVGAIFIVPEAADALLGITVDFAAAPAAEPDILIGVLAP